jgi:hypothetical protein
MAKAKKDGKKKDLSSVSVKAEDAHGDSPESSGVPKEPKADKKTKAKARAKKNKDAQFEKVDMSAGEAPEACLVFLEDKTVWKVLTKPGVGQVKLWRLKQAGGDEIIEIPSTQAVKVQKLYLE